VHRDYFQSFFKLLTPSFLGRQKDLLALREIEAKVQKERPDDSQFLKLLSEEA
jgi:hypothetical protein